MAQSDIFTVQSGLEALQADLADVKARYCVCDDGNGGGSGHGSHKPTTNRIRSSAAVAFSARVFSTQESASLTKEVVPFNMAELDTNNAFNETSSTFTVPEDGLYDIALTLTGDAYSANNSSTSQNSGAQTSFEATLKVNHVTKAAMLVRHDQTSSLTVNLKLVKGQQLRVEATSASGASVRTERFSSFSGTLLN
ncbi:uncharacterized protein LOC101862457 [Aplysia californica]|uniref:Uncharacterized protein LOC101862457 n=1 Tax=Aplysia californica TaxID=6500 RepID=A0ABM0K783_APLCA|nr:uncharacterized protein LOC101862457 [Aplysia californica]